METTAQTLKNIKVPAHVHAKIKVLAAPAGLNIQEYLDKTTKREVRRDA